jgi:hypothetical protein
MKIQNALFIFGVTLLLAFGAGCNRSSRIGGGPVQSCTGANCGSTLYCQMMINNAYTLRFSGSGGTAPATVEVRANQTGATLNSLEVRPSGSSNSTSVGIPGMTLASGISINIPGPAQEGQVLATVRKGTVQVSCSANYKVVQSSPQPTGQLLYVTLGYNILGWDQTSGYWFRRNASNVAEAFAKWPTGVIYDNVMAGDFNGDQKADIIGRNPASGEFYVALADVVSDTPVLAFTTDASKPPTGLRVADITNDGRSDVIFTDGNGAEVSYQPEQVYNGIYFRGPIAAPPTLTLTVTPPGIIPAGMSARIQWTSNVTGCTLYSPTGTVIVTAQGPVTGKTGTYDTPALTVSHTLVMQCVNGQGGNPLVRQIPLQVGPPLVSNLSLSSDKEFVAVNGTVNITIALSNVHQCVLDRDGTPVPVPVSLQVSQTLATLPAKFTANCKKLSGEPVSATKTIYGAIVLGKTPASINFGQAYPNSTSAAQLFTVTNPHPTHTVQVASVTMPTNNAFKLGQVKCGAAIIAAGQPWSIAPNTNCTVGVIFKPTSVNNYSSSLKINYGDGIGMNLIHLPVSGNCVAQTAAGK